MKITEVNVFRLSGSREVTDTEPSTPQAHPIDIYPENKRTPTSALKPSTRQVNALFVEIATDEGLSGLFGPIQKDLPPRRTVTIPDPKKE